MIHTDILIVGGGVIGLTTAYYLSKKGLTVKVLDRGVLGAEASWSGAGIIPPGKLHPEAAPMDQLRAISAEQYPTLSQELKEITGVENGYHVCGGVEFLEEFEAPLADGWRREGIEVEALDASTFQQRFPGVNRITDRSCYLPEMAQVRNPWHLKALISACIVKRVQVRPKLGFTMFKAEEDQIVGVRLTNWETLSADRYLIAAGAWSGQLLADLGVTVHVRPVRGQMVLFHLPERPFEPILLHGKCYIVPRQDGRVLVGATEEHDAGFSKLPTEEGVRGLVQFAERLCPTLEHAEIETTWAGLRPHTIDGLPYMGRVPGYRNLFIATGHFRSGIQLSPATAQVMTEMICSEVPSIPMESFSLNREPHSSYRPTFRS
jgi:glycine oxidase